jgi:TonB family protein
MRTSLAATLAVGCMLGGMAVPHSSVGHRRVAPDVQADATRHVRGPVPAPEWRLHVPLDSGAVLVAVTSRSASVEIIAPTGTFFQAFATPAPLAAWADAAERLAGPLPSAPADTNGGSPSPERYASAPLAPERDPATRFDLTDFVLTREHGGVRPAYRLTGSNGAWSFALRLDPEQAAALLAALRGRAEGGARRYETPRFRETTGPEGAWLGAEVDRVVRPGIRPPRPVFPVVLQGTGTAGSVRLSFIVESTGLVRPSSIRLIGKTHPALARAARDALASAVYEPAQFRGRHVAQHVIQDFQFRQP